MDEGTHFILKVVYIIWTTDVSVKLSGKEGLGGGGVRERSLGETGRGGLFRSGL